MSLKPFLVIIDTTEATMLQTVGKGILNVHVIMSTDPVSAKQTFLRVFSPMVRNQIFNSIYVYDVDEMKESLAVTPSDRLPLFSFLPLAGGRPPKQVDGQQLTLGNKTIEPNVNTQVNQQPQVQQAPVQQHATKPQINLNSITNSPRSKEFQTYENDLPNSSEALSSEQAKLIRNMGVTRQDTNEEGSNLRVNSSVGRNMNLRQPQQDPQVQMNQEQMAILSKIGAATQPTGIVHEEDIESSEKVVVEDPSLTQVDGGVLSDIELQKLQDEIKEIK